MHSCDLQALHSTPPRKCRLIDNCSKHRTCFLSELSCGKCTFLFHQPAPVPLSSSAFLAEKSVREPGRLFIFVIYKLINFWMQSSKNCIFDFENRSTAAEPAAASSCTVSHMYVLVYRMTCKYSNNTGFQHCFEEGCRCIV